MMPDEVVVPDEVGGSPVTPGVMLSDLAGNAGRRVMWGTADSIFTSEECIAHGETKHWCGAIIFFNMRKIISY
jgi:hypothetical protein